MARLNVPSLASRCVVRGKLPGVPRNGIFGQMDAWITLLAGIAGAVIALGGQQWGIWNSSRTRAGELLLEQCAQLIALSEDFRNRAWEETVLGQKGRVDGWDVAAHRLAMARARILCKDSAVLEALAEMEESGKEYGGHLRRGDVSEEELAALRDRNRASINALASASSTVIRRRLKAI